MFLKRFSLFFGGLIHIFEETKLLKIIILKNNTDKLSKLLKIFCEVPDVFWFLNSQRSFWKSGYGKLEVVITWNFCTMPSFYRSIRCFYSMYELINDVSCLIRYDSCIWPRKWKKEKWKTLRELLYMCCLF